MRVVDFGYGLKRMICECGKEVDVRKIEYIAVLERERDELRKEGLWN